MAEWTPPEDAVASDNKEWTPPTDAIFDGDEKKKSISEPLGLKPLEQSSGQKNTIPSYATPDVQSLSKSDSPTLKSTPLQSDGIKMETIHPLNLSQDTEMRLPPTS